MTLFDDVYERDKAQKPIDLNMEQRQLGYYGVC